MLAVSALAWKQAAAMRPLFFFTCLLCACGEPEVQLPEAYDPNGGDAGRSAPFDAGSEGPVGEDAASPEQPDGGSGADHGSADGGPINCDEDRDGWDSEACGGRDCNDQHRGVNPDAREVCDFDDNDCDQAFNEDLDCTFLAAGPSTLYRVDPFRERVDVLGEVDLPAGQTLLDMDTDPDGDVLGLTRNGLYDVQENGRTRRLAQVSIDRYTNGMAIGGDGTIFLTSGDRNANRADLLDRNTGETTLLGNTAPFTSSGDCVVLKDESLLMSAKRPDGPQDTDWLVFVDRSDGSTEAIGSIGFDKVYGLSASFDYLFGLTDNGEVLLIDSNLGRGELLFQAPEGLRFWGAANGD